MGQFGIGQAVRRKEDVRFITGTGRFTDDVSRPRQAYAYFLRSPHAHARLIAIDSAAAKAAPGILAVYTYADIAAAGLGLIKCAAPVKNRDGSDYVNPGRPSSPRTASVTSATRSPCWSRRPWRRRRTPPS